AITWYMDALLVFAGRLHPPDQRLDGFELAEVKRMLARLAVVPVLQQAARDAGDAGVVRRAPGIHALADAHHRVQRLRAARVGTGVEHLVTGGPAPLRQRQAAALLGPVA